MAAYFQELKLQYSRRRHRYQVSAWLAPFCNTFNNMTHFCTAVPMKPCDYVPAAMLESDAGKSFPDETHYRFRCLADNAVYPVHEAICHDGTWYHNPNDCFVAPTQGSTLQIGGLESKWTFRIEKTRSHFGVVR